MTDAEKRRIGGLLRAHLARLGNEEATPDNLDVYKVIEQGMAGRDVEAFTLILREKLGARG